MAVGGDLEGRMTAVLDDLYETWDPKLTPWTEVDPRNHLQRSWASDGVVILPGLIPDELMSAYEREWLAANADSPGGWDYATPYVDHPRLRHVVCSYELDQVLKDIIGEPMAVHLNLTGWISTRRDWHRDQYLNEPYVGGYYAAVWIALADIHPDSGPFQYVPGSHHGRPISQLKIRAALQDMGYDDGPMWPKHSEAILTSLFEREITETNAEVVTHLPKRGDVLIWHGKLLHRGSVPNDPTRERRALIAHYSGIHHRPDMPDAVRHPDGGLYFPLSGRQPVR